MVEIFDDITQQYQFRAPCPELSGLIEYFWESAPDPKVTPDGPFSVTLFPSWTPTLSINLGTPHQLSLGKDQYVIRSGDAFLTFRNCTAYYRYTPGHYKFGLKFFPGGLNAIFPDADAVLTAKLIPLQSLVPAALVGKLLHTSGFQMRVDLLQEFLLGRFRKQADGQGTTLFLRKMIHQYQLGNMELSLGQLAGQLCMTPKTLYRNFSKAVGATPKQYLAHLQARTALRAYLKDRTDFSPYDYGYYDRSHFHKAVARLTGEKLGDQLR
jgi:AraC-like DNA-binding protein